MKSNREQRQDMESERTTNSKPIPHIPLPFEEVMKDVLKVKPPEKKQKSPRKTKAK